MLKKIARDLVIVFCFAALYVSTSRSAMERICDLRRVNTWWGAYDWYYGNLSGMSHLDFVQRFRTPEDYSRTIPDYHIPRTTVLYLHGDSHTRHPRLADTDFAGVAEFHFINEHSRHTVHIDTSKRNILIIEIAENHVRMNIPQPDLLQEIIDSPAVSDITWRSTGKSPGYAAMADYFSLNDFFNPYINQNLEMQLFNYNFLMPAFGFKAAINYQFFHRASGNVVISNDGNFLFFKETAEMTGTNSAFSPVTASDITNLIDSLNLVNDHYRKMGFKEIYLSMIPNAVTILQPGGYNQLIPLIQNDKRLKMKVIDMYTAFQNKGNECYLHGDTHWTNAGFRIWLSTVNKILENPPML